MSSATTVQAHIAYEVIDDRHPDIVLVEFLSHEIAGPHQSEELGEQLDSLIRADLPSIFVIDFAQVRSLGSTAFGEIMSFARKVDRLYICNLRDHLRLGAALIGLDECAEVAMTRQAAINRDAARPCAAMTTQSTIPAGPLGNSRRKRLVNSTRMPPV